MGMVPVKGGIEEDALAELVLFWFDLLFMLGRLELEQIAHEDEVVEVAEGNGCELDASEFDVEVCLFLGDAGDVAEIAEEIVYLPDFYVMLVSEADH